MDIGSRIKELRLSKKMTQTQLADVVGLSYIQIGRYEKGKSNPSSDILQKLAEAFGTSSDFIMNGSSENIAGEKITDRELLNLFKSVEELDNEDKKMIKTFLDAIVTKRKIQNLAS